MAGSSVAGSSAEERWERFSAVGFEGQVRIAAKPDDLAAALSRVLDPASAQESLHWGRNYLYSTSWPGPDRPRSVVVKQFRNQGLRERLRRRWRGTKAERSFRAAQALEELGLGTPEPILYADSVDSSGPSFYVTEYRPELLEARYLLRSLNAGTEDRDYPQIDASAVLQRLGALARKLHEGGFFHRDLSSGNVLLRRERFAPGSGGQCDDGFLLVDLNRARWGARRLSTWNRMRDLSRLPLERPAHRNDYLRGYWDAGEPGRLRRLSATLQYELLRRSFLVKNRSKKRIRGGLRWLQELVLPRRRPHVHIPAAAPGASLRDKVVWDPLSDQPHQHAARFEKLLVRAADAPAHLRAVAVALRALPRARRRYLELRQELHQRPVPWRGVGVALRPWDRDPAALLELVETLGVEHLLLRLHPWDSCHEREAELAAELVQRGYGLSFALPQNRDLVRDPGRWRAAVEELAERFVPFGQAFQVGQALNRSKWGIWRPSEYIRLFEIAAECLRAQGPVELLGPAVIDFEMHATATFLNLPAPGLGFDILSSLLYVDRRGAPENRQMGLDTVDKVTLLKAFAETSRNCPSGRSWITEVNWPLREGPHAPAGRDVAVSEHQQANYLVRYYLLALCTGLVERVYWWQVIHKGYGLVDPGSDGLRRRPAYSALAQLQCALAGATFEGPVGTAAENQRLYRFSRAGGGALLVGWTIDDGESPVEVPGRVTRATGRDGEEMPLPQGRLSLGPAPIYLDLEEP